MGGGSGGRQWGRQSSSSERKRKKRNSGITKRFGRFITDCLMGKFGLKVTIVYCVLFGGKSAPVVNQVR